MFDQIASAVKTILPKLYGDPLLAKIVTYRKYNGVSFDPTVGFNVERWKTYSVKAIKLTSPLQSKTATGYEGGRTVVQGGETLFMIKSEDLPDGISVKDSILDERNVTYNVKRIEPIFGLLTKITAVSSV